MEVGSIPPWALTMMIRDLVLHAAMQEISPLCVVMAGLTTTAETSPHTHTQILNVLVCTTRECSKNKDSTFSRDFFVFLSVTRRPSRPLDNIPRLRSQSWDIAQYPEIANQSNCAIIGGSHVLDLQNTTLHVFLLLRLSP